MAYGDRSSTLSHLTEDTGRELDSNLQSILSTLQAPMADRAWVYEASGTAGVDGLTNAYQAFDITDAALPDAARLSLLQGSVSNITTMATVSWYLAEDSAGKYPLTPINTWDCSANVGLTAGFQVFAETLEATRKLSSKGTTDHLYWIAKGDAGTADF